MIGTKVNGFNTWIHPFVAYVIANMLHLRVAATQAATLGTDLTDWDTKFGIYSNILTQTHGSIGDINTDYDEFHHETNLLRQQIKNDVNVILSGDDRVALDIPEDPSPRGHVPPSATGPVNTQLRATHLQAEIFTSNPVAGHETEKALPEGVVKIGRKIAYVLPGAPIPTVYGGLPSVGSTVFHLLFTEDQKNMVAYIITWYINNRGEEGPPSPPYPFTII